MYHQVSSRPAPAFRKYTVSPGGFAAQMRWLAFARYTPIGFDTWLDPRAALPERPVIITFDDGFRDCLKHAVPVLQAHRFTAVFYLVAGRVGSKSDWLSREGAAELELIDWSEARQLIGAGLQIGAHSLTHPHLAELPEAECRRELQESRSVLEDHLGCEVRHLAYPFGSFDARVCTLAAQAGFRSACTVVIRRASAKDSPMALPRVPVTGQDSLLDFISRLRSGWRVSQAARSQLQRLTGGGKGQS